MICISFIDVKATNNLGIIVAGDGTFENPYILKDDNNEIAQFIIENYEKKTSKSNEVSQYANQIFTGSTEVNTSKTINSKGAYWRYTGGGQTTDYNGSLVFTLIEYTPNGLLVNMQNNLNKPKIKNVLADVVNTTTTLALATKKLTEAGAQSATIAGALLPVIGFGLGAYGVLSTMNIINTALNNQIIQDAIDNNHHIMTVHYKTSYNGAWYLHSTIEESLSYNNPQIPKSYYGLGTFINSPRLG